MLYDSTGRELERNHNTNRRDPLIDFSVPSDGDYLVSLHDHSYGYFAVPGECYYRLSISTAPYLDFIFPPADVPGSKRQYTVYGRNLPGGKPAPGVTFGGKQLEMLPVTIPLPGANFRRARPGWWLVRRAFGILRGRHLLPVEDRRGHLQSVAADTGRRRSWSRVR